MAEYLKSPTVTNYDATPIVMPTAGEGGKGNLVNINDYVANTTSIAQWSTYRMARFVTNAKIKQVQVYNTGTDNSSTPAGVMDFNVAFSDATTDGTPVSYQGTLPSSKLDGTSFAFTNGTGYSTAYLNSGTGNKLFGQVSMLASGAIQYKDITYNGASNIYTIASTNDDMWDVLGFVNGAGTAQDPGGKFDIFVVISTAPASAHAGVIGVELDYCV